MQILMLTNVYAAGGTVLAKGTTQTVALAFGQQLVGEGRALDLEGALGNSGDYLSPVVAGVETAAPGIVFPRGTLIRDETGLIEAQADGTGGALPFGAGGGGSSYLGAAASAAAMTALPAVVGSECLRSDIGTGGIRYELTALPAGNAANWQPLQGSLTDASVVTLALVDGKLPRRLLAAVANGCQVTVTVGGVTQPAIVETVAGQYTSIDISDDPAAAQPTTVTLQRTAGSGACTYSLEA